MASELLDAGPYIAQYIGEFLHPTQRAALRETCKQMRATFAPAPRMTTIKAIVDCIERGHIAHARHLYAHICSRGLPCKQEFVVPQIPPTCQCQGHVFMLMLFIVFKNYDDQTAMALAEELFGGKLDLVDRPSFMGEHSAHKWRALRPLLMRNRACKSICAGGLTSISGEIFSAQDDEARHRQFDESGGVDEAPCGYAHAKFDHENHANTFGSHRCITIIAGCIARGDIDGLIRMADRMPRSAMHSIHMHGLHIGSAINRALYKSFIELGIAVGLQKNYFEWAIHSAVVNYQPEILNDLIDYMCTSDALEKMIHFPYIQAMLAQDRDEFQVRTTSANEQARDMFATIRTIHDRLPASFAEPTHAHTYVHCISTRIWTLGLHFDKQMIVNGAKCLADPVLSALFAWCAECPIEQLSEEIGITNDLSLVIMGSHISAMTYVITQTPLKVNWTRAILRTSLPTALLIYTGICLARDNGTTDIIIDVDAVRRHVGAVVFTAFVAAQKIGSAVRTVWGSISSFFRP